MRSRGSGFFTGLPRRQPPVLTPLDLSAIHIQILVARTQASLRRVHEANIEVQKAWENVLALRQQP